MNKKIDWQGHRGCRGILPENTIIAFTKAIDLGVTTLEMDVVITGDKKVIVSHEPYFSHKISTSPNGEEITSLNEKSFNIFNMSYEEIRKWDVGIKGNEHFPDQIKIPSYKPLLEETLMIIENYIEDNNLAKTNYSIEIKSFADQEETYHPEPTKFAEMVMNVINAAGLMDRTVIQSFDYRIINAIKKKDKKIKCSFLFDDDINHIHEKMKSLIHFPDIVGLQYKLVNRDIVRHFHHNNIKVIPWTINTRQEILNLIDMGVDGIITDFPNLIGEIRVPIAEKGISLAAVL